jgi:hypothetical protein
MSRFWLVQRVLYEDYERARFWNDHPSRFSLAYMGSSEFEFGSTAASLKRLVPIADALVFERTTIRGFSFDIIRKPTDLEGTANLAVWLDATLDPGRRAQTTKEYPHGLLARLEGRLDPTPPPGRGGKEHQRKMYSWTANWAESGVLHWDLDADFFFALTPGQGPDSQPAGGIAAAFLAEIRAVAAARRAA